LCSALFLLALKSKKPPLNFTMPSACKQETLTYLPSSR
jgi:hypothetical protein